MNIVFIIEHKHIKKFLGVIEQVFLCHFKPIFGFALAVLGGHVDDSSSLLLDGGHIQNNDTGERHLHSVGRGCEIFDFNQVLLLELLYLSESLV